MSRSLSLLALSALALTFLSTLQPISAHSQMAWVKVGNSREYPAWNLDDHYKALYRKKDPVWGAIPEQKYTRKTDATDLGPTDIFSKAIATGGYQDPLDYDDISPVGVITGNAGDEVTMKWEDAHWPYGHPGPIGEWMAKCPGTSCTKVDPTTLDWFSIAQHNWDEEKGLWPTEIFFNQGKVWRFKLPVDLPGGAYLVRHELFAYHNNTPPHAGLGASPQHYPVAFELQLSSSGSSLPTLTGKFPGIFSYDDMEWRYDIYQDRRRHKDFEFPGIAVYPGGYTTGVVNGASAGKGTKGEPSVPAQQPSSSSTSSKSTSTSSSKAASSTASASNTAVPDAHTFVAVIPSSSTAAPSQTSAKHCRARRSRARRVRRRHGSGEFEA